MIRLGFLALIAAPLFAAAPAVDFARDIRPILSDNCFTCHGPDEHRRIAGVRLDTREGALAVVTPGQPEKSRVYIRVSDPDPRRRMPPPSTGRKLTDRQIQLIQQWIASGAEYKVHWAYESPRRPDPPSVSSPRWTRNPIDNFVLARLDAERLHPSPEADRPTLLRRLSFDLTGLPPTPAEIDAFLNDSSPKAYEAQVDRLLASPHYGERMAMQWLDLARYADTHGFHIDSHRDMWPWRDWVIRAYNTNMPFDRFTVEQLAGDLLPNATTDQKIASGFNRNHMINYEGGAIEEEYRTEYVADRAETTSTVWLAMTMGCARCHDHKYDPIPQKDFYRMFAFFNNVKEKGLDGKDGNAEPFLSLATPEQQHQLDALNTRIQDREAAVNAAEINDPPAPEPLPTLQNGLVPSLQGREFALSMWLEQGFHEPMNVFGQPGVVQIWYDASEPLPHLRRGAHLHVEANGLHVQTRERLVQGELHHIAITVYPASIEIHLNGKAAPADASTQHSESLLPFKGRLLDLRLFNRPLERSEIDYLATHSRVPTLLVIAPDKRTKKETAELRDYYLTYVAPAPVRQAWLDLNKLRAAKAALLDEIPTTMVMAETDQPRDTFVLGRGDYRNHGEKVVAATPSALPPLHTDHTPNRLDLARWLARPDHPLTARVAVNRFWQNFFGIGLVKTSENFGSQGDPPSHPELLDWLATEFVRTGWDVKAIQRLIVTSATYRQSSQSTPELNERDPENRLLARMSRFRLPAEMVRDNALAVSGLLDQHIGGKSVFPYQPSGVWEEISRGEIFSAQVYKESAGPDLYRRSLYWFWKRSAPPTSLTTFDAPDREKCTARRSLTNTPLQALVLLNDPTFVEAARVLAERIIAQPGDPSARVDRAFRIVTGRMPQPRERQILTKLASSQLAHYRAGQSGAGGLITVGARKPDPRLNPAELAAWTNVVTVILNMDETITKE